MITSKKILAKELSNNSHFWIFISLIAVIIVCGYFLYCTLNAILFKDGGNNFLAYVILLKLVIFLGGASYGLFLLITEPIKKFYMENGSLYFEENGNEPVTYKAEDIECVLLFIGYTVAQGKWIFIKKKDQFIEPVCLSSRYSSHNLTEMRKDLSRFCRFYQLSFIVTREEASVNSFLTTGREIPQNQSYVSTGSQQVTIKSDIITKNTTGDKITEFVDMKDLSHILQIVNRHDTHWYIVKNNGEKIEVSPDVSIPEKCVYFSRRLISFRKK